ncbi:MAG: SDR family oxidoreductase [Rhizobiales bacterium]|nr:SDR family oxidoreductase [Hyphomicrobiales bacterium]
MADSDLHGHLPSRSIRTRWPSQAGLIVQLQENAMTTGTRLQDKVAIITGAAKGIGAATAHMFVREGAAVGLFDKDSEALKATAEELLKKGARVVALPGDVTSAGDISKFVETVVKELGGVNILVNNAGVTLTRPFVETTVDDVDFLVSVNLKGLMLFSQAAIPHMEKAGGGAIVHDASNAGIVGRPWQPMYGATKAGVVSLTKSMALSLAKQNIRVNCICPGSIDTPMLRGALASSGQFEQNWRRTELVIPLGRIGAANDIAAATLFLASDEAQYITGVALPVDGGRTAGVAEVHHLGLDVS